MTHPPAFKFYKIGFLLLLLLAFDHSTPPALSATSDTSLADGVTYHKYTVSSSGGDLGINMVLIEQDALKIGHITIDSTMGGDTVGESCSPGQMCSQVDGLAAINGPYFASDGGTQYPLGFATKAGHILRLGNLKRPMVGITSRGEFKIEVAHPTAFVTSEKLFKPLFLWDVNTPAGHDSVTLYTREWGKNVSPQDGVVVTCGPYTPSKKEIIVITSDTQYRSDWDGVVTATSTSDPLKIPDGGFALVFRGGAKSAIDRFAPGAKVLLYAYELPDGWERMRWIATIGPWFVHNGRLRDYSNETKYSGNILGRADRTFIGTTWNDEIFFAVTTGASVDVKELADLLINLNVREAVMCDSGSSSSMWVKGIGAIGGSKEIPLGFVVRKLSKPLPDPKPLKVWTEKIKGR
jgi:hypothetical protein